MKNAIVLPVYNSLLDSPQYKICADIWKLYCDKNNIEFHLLKGEKIFNNNIDPAACCYDRWIDITFSESEYNRITFVDADTFPRWDLPDINKLFDDNNLDIVVIKDQGGDMVGLYHFNQWKYFKPKLNMNNYQYFNAGIISLRPKHLKHIQSELPFYKDYYYSEKDINGHVVGIGKENGVRIDAMDQTAINIILQEYFFEEISFLNKEFNCQVPYLFNSIEDFKNNYKNFDFLNKGYIFHLGSTTLIYTDIINEFWSKFKENYK